AVRPGPAFWAPACGTSRPPAGGTGPGWPRPGSPARSSCAGRPAASPLPCPGRPGPGPPGKAGRIRPGPEPRRCPTGARYRTSGRLYQTELLVSYFSSYRFPKIPSCRAEPPSLRFYYSTIPRNLQQVKMKISAAPLVKFSLDIIISHSNVCAEREAGASRGSGAESEKRGNIMLDIKITRTAAPKAKPEDESKLGFGKIFTDHMFVMNYTAGQGWHDARIVPYGPFQLDPATAV